MVLCNFSRNTGAIGIYRSELRNQYIQIPLGVDLGPPNPLLLLHVGCKVLRTQGLQHAGDPLLAGLGDLLRVRQVLLNTGMLLDEEHQVLQVEPYTQMIS